LGGQFDVITVLSLFSHLPHATFGRWLAALYQHLTFGGVLLFTTHGLTIAQRFVENGVELLDEKKGYGFWDRSDQPDINIADYGTMVVTPAYVRTAIAQHCPMARLLSFRRDCWFGAMQDEWLIRRTRYGVHRIWSPSEWRRFFSND
jgi:hypothetical protein